jgi:hypothetical protein
MSTLNAGKVMLAGLLFIAGAYLFGTGMMNNIFSVPTVLGAVLIVAGLAVWTTTEEKTKTVRKKNARR